MPQEQPEPQAQRRSHITVRQGANLPHWRVDNAMYSVTFRLNDSLPASVLQRLKWERDEAIRDAETLARPFTGIEYDRIQYIFSERVEEWLDRGHGSCVLKNPAIATLVRDALYFRNDVEYQLLAWCIMPNHVHVVVHMFRGVDLSRATHGWKGFSAKEARKLLNSTGSGPLWQPEPYDHLIRDSEDLGHHVQYTLNNPAAAGLKNWPWIGGLYYKPQTP